MAAIRKVGLIGLGNLGEPMAKNLVKAGFDLAVYDVRPEPMDALKRLGATACASVAELGARSEVIVSMLLNIAQTKSVLFGANGLITVIRPGAKLVIGSTIGPGPMVEIADAFKEKGVPVIDAAMAGGQPRAEQGTLTLMVGADPAAFEEITPVLRAVGSNIIRAGAVGTGQMAKLANNLVLGINIIALLEGLSFGVAAGIEPETLKEIFRKSSANSYPLQVWDELGPRWKGMLASRRSDAEIPLSKDLRLAQEFAKDLGISLVLGTQACAVWNGEIAIDYKDARRT